MEKSHLNTLYAAHQNCSRQVNRNEVVIWLEKVLAILIPEYKIVPIESAEELEIQINKACQSLNGFLCLNQQDKADSICHKFCERMVRLKTLIDLDAEAIYKGDPAAASLEEVRHAYLSFYAISSYRIANVLYDLGAEILPRIITEHAHGKTGIDIHPAATIGESFFIDHGTGVVIGETADIGNNVKIYQGVTLGALSVSKNSANTKRHPTVKDNVVIYANATILGGDTVIGENSVIGGNVWLVKSVPADSKIYYSTHSHEDES